MPSEGMAQAWRSFWVEIPQWGIFSENPQFLSLTRELQPKQGFKAASLNPNKPAKHHHALGQCSIAALRVLSAKSFRNVVRNGASQNNVLDRRIHFFWKSFAFDAVGPP